MKKLIDGLLMVIFFLIYFNIFDRLIRYTIGGFWSDVSVLIGSIIMVVLSIVLAILTKEKVVEIIRD